MATTEVLHKVSLVNPTVRRLCRATEPAASRLPIAVQGGRFDHADRLFTSLPRAWTQVLKNSSDVKEMVPEFYYNAAFLCNAEGLDLGRTHSGTAVDDVELPRWAAGSPDEFIRIHRCATPPLAVVGVGDLLPVSATAVRRCGSCTRDCAAARSGCGERPRAQGACLGVCDWHAFLYCHPRGARPTAAPLHGNPILL